MNLCYGDSPLGPSEKLERERPISHTAGKRRDSRPSLVNLTGKISVEGGETRQGAKNPEKPSVKNDGANAADRQREEEEEGEKDSREWQEYEWAGWLCFTASLLFRHLELASIYSDSHRETASSKNTRRSILESTRLDLVMRDRQKQIRRSCRAEGGETILIIRLKTPYCSKLY